MSPHRPTSRRDVRDRRAPLFVAAALACTTASSALGARAADHDGEPVARPSVIELAASAGTFETLLAAAEATGFVADLEGAGPFTVFAPTDEALGRLPDGTVDRLLAEPGRATLRGILARHVLPGVRATATDLVDRRAVRTVQGARIDLAIGAGGLEVGGARVVQPDLLASDGVVHVIDRVILPPDRGIPKIAEDAGVFSTLLRAVVAADLADVVGGPGPFTVFAPTDDAFAALPSGALDALLLPANREALREVLKLHVVPGYVYAEDALGGASVTTASGGTVHLRFEDGTLRANEARVTTADLDAANGVVHVIDRVLLPEGFTVPAAGRLVVGIFSEAPSSSLRSLLDLERGQGLAIDRTTRDGGARAAGLRADDVILAIDGEIATSDGLAEAKRRVGAGGTLKLLVVREVEVEVRVDDH